MSLDIGTLVGHLKLDDDTFDASLRQVPGKMSNAGSNGGTLMGNGILGALKSFAGPIAASLGAFAAVDFAKDTIGQASRLGESANAIKVVYGDASGAIADLGADSAKRLRLSQADFNSIAVQFSSFAGTIAGPGGDIAGTIDNLTTRGADFASVMDMEVSDAMGAFQSGLAGEAEPLKKFGIDLSEANVKAFAYANGIAETGTELTEAQKVQARYGSLMEQTAKTAGDSANTSDSYANATRSLKEQWEDFQAKLGADVMPMLEGLMGFINDTGLPALKDFAEGVKNAFKWISENANIVVPAIAAIGTVLLVSLAPAMWAAVTATWAFTTALLANPLTWIALAIGALIGIIILLVMNWDAVVKFITDVWGGFIGWITDGLNAFFKWWNDLWTGFGGMIADIWNGIVRFITDAWNNIIGGIRGGWDAVMKFIGGIPKAIGDFFGGIGSWLFNAGRDLINGLFDGIKSLAGNIGKFFLNLLPGWIVAPFKLALGIKSPSKVFAGFGRNIAEGIMVGIDDTQSALDARVTSMVTVPASNAIGLNGTAAGGAGYSTSLVINGNVGWDANEVARQTEARQRQASALAGITGILGVA